MANAIDVDTQISLLLYRMGPVSLRELMTKIARYLKAQNVIRIAVQKNADGSAYTARKNGIKKPMLVGYAKRIREQVAMDQAVVGIFGRMSNFGLVHDQGKTERRVKYPARNILALPSADKEEIIMMIQQHISGTT